MRAECPRCGYDLSGVVESWKESCPVEGVCSECGLGVEWSRIMNEPVPPKWFVEGGTGVSMLRASATLLMLFRPIAFWRGVRLEYALRLRLVFLMLLAVFAAVSVAALAAEWIIRAQSGAALISVMSASWGGVRWFEGVPFIKERFLWLLGFCAAIPWAFALLCFAISGSLRKARVRAGHVVRVALYNTMSLGFFSGMVSAVWVGLKVAERFTPAGVLPSWCEPILELLEGGWLVIWPVFVIVWWWAAFRFYMHLRRAFIGTVLTFVASVLLIYAPLLLLAVLTRRI